MAKYILKKKGCDSNELWTEVFNNIEDYVSKEEIDRKIEETVDRTRGLISLTGGRIGYAWSAGKDSIAMRYILGELGISGGVFITARNFQAPSFRRWLDKYTPADVEVYDLGIDYKWLLEHKQFLFPKNSIIDGKWMKYAQWDGQERFCKENNLDMIMLGRRTQDGNICGKGGLLKNKRSRAVKCSPLWDWKHEDILAVIRYYNLPLPSNYYDPNDPEGWYLGSALWIRRPAFVKTEKEIWEILFKVEKEIVIEASEYFPLAKRVVEANK